jgi:hypothetical protein
MVVGGLGVAVVGRLGVGGWGWGCGLQEGVTKWGRAMG